MSVQTFLVFHDRREWHVYDRERDASVCRRTWTDFALSEANMQFVESHSIHFCRKCKPSGDRRERDS